MAGKKPEYFIKKCSFCKGVGCKMCNGLGIVRVLMEDIRIQNKTVYTAPAPLPQGKPVTVKK
jgi:hypothetical protein